MLHRIRAWFAPPVFSDNDAKTYLAARTQVIWTVLLLLALLSFSLLLIEQRFDRIRPLLPIAVLLPVVRMMLLQGRVRLAAILTSVGAWLFLFLGVLETGGIWAAGYGSSAILTILVSGILLGRPGIIVTLVVNLLVGIVLMLADAQGWIAGPPATVTPLMILLGALLQSLLAAGLLYVATSNTQAALEQARREMAGRRNVEEALRLSEERYRLLAGHLPNSAIILFDRELRFVLVDGPELEQTGYSKAAMEGKLLYDALPADFVQVVEENMRAVLAGKQFRAELPFGERSYLYTYLPICGQDDQVLYGLILAQNITERKRFEAEIQEKEEKFRTIFDLAPYDITLTKTDGTFVDVNRAFLARQNLPLEQVVGRSYAEVMQVDPQTVSTIIEHLQTSDYVYNLETPTFKHDGSEHYALLSTQQLMLAGEPHLLTVAVDITALKEAEAAREQLIAELEARNAELERFTYTVSHDLKSPLITIRGFLSFLQQDALSGNVERLHKDISRIDAAARRMQQLLDDLLELSRIGRLVNPPERVPFADIVAEALELVQGQLIERGVTVSVAPDLPMVYGDRLRLVEVMQNLLDNAARFMGDQPVPRVEIGVRQDADTPVFFVRDNGRGIEPPYQERVFGLFEQLDASSEGTGIGLALVRRIIEVHGGRIWAESAGLGQGATFCFILPEME